MFCSEAGGWFWVCCLSACGVFSFVFAISDLDLKGRIYVKKLIVLWLSEFIGEFMLVAFWEMDVIRRCKFASFHAILTLVSQLFLVHVTMIIADL